MVLKLRPAVDILKREVERSDLLPGPHSFTPFIAVAISCLGEMADESVLPTLQDKVKK